MDFRGGKSMWEMISRLFLGCWLGFDPGPDFLLGPGVASPRGENLFGEVGKGEFWVTLMGSWFV